MSTRNALHYVSHLKWLFLIPAVILILYALIVVPENLVTLIGIIIFLLGIQMGLESLEDSERMSDKQRLFYLDGKKIRRQSIIILTSSSVLIIISLLFMSLKFIFRSRATPLFEEFFYLGLDCWALILGMLCMLKSTHDKHEWADSRTE